MLMMHSILHPCLHAWSVAVQTLLFVADKHPGSLFPIDCYYGNHVVALQACHCLCAIKHYHDNNTLL